jgi:hypothetical protein
LRRRVSERVKTVPAADLEMPQLRMLERFPRDVRDTSQLVFAPSVELEVVTDRMVAEPLDVLVVFDAGLATAQIRRPS